MNFKEVYILMQWHRLIFPVKTVLLEKLCVGARWRQSFYQLIQYTLCLKKTTVTLHTITSMHINRFW